MASKEIRWEIYDRIARFYKEKYLRTFLEISKAVTGILEREA